MRLLATLLALASMVAPTIATSQPRANERAVAITFDDLPATPAGMVAHDIAALTDMTRRLLSTVRKYNVPAIGFVNEGKLFVAGNAGVAARTGLLRMWIDAGLELGNHSYSHRDLNVIPLEEFQADVIRGEAVTRPLMEAAGRTLRYFRHPFLHVGRTLPQRRAFEAFLDTHGYAVAPVTVDTDDYLYAAAYAAALRRGDKAAASRIGDDYVRYMDEVVAYFEAVSRRVAGREILQIVLLHANSVNADRFGAIAESLVRRGYRFISLSEALEDDIYRTRDDFVGVPGNSWFNHWEITAGRKPVPTPKAADWVMKGGERF